MQKNTNKIKKSGTNFDLTADSLIENIKLFQTSLKNVLLTFLPILTLNNVKSDTIWLNIFKPGNIFLSKNLFCQKGFQWLSNSKFFSLMTKVNPSNGNETKSDVFL